jgi:capsular polysaccharide biosynthesis protein
VSAYQVDTIELLKQRLPVEFVAVEADDPFTAGPAFNSPGMTFGGGQRIGAIVGEYADWLRRHFGVRKIASTGRRIYVSRNESKMRRVVNEDDLLPMLEKLGFEIVRPGLLPLAQQVREFASADVVVSPHGAGLTNILFCRPDAKLVEIFPEGGVHGSAFLRIASQRRMPYAFFVAAKVATPQGEANPNNSDLEIDAHAFERFLATHAT